MCIWAKVILVVGIIIGVCALITGTIVGFVIADDEETLLFIIPSIIVSSLITIPSILMWATVRLLAKMSLNLSDTNSAIIKMSTIVETNLKKKIESKQPTDVNSKTNSKPITPSKQTVQENKPKPMESVLIVLDEINKKGGSETDKLCRLMEMRDDGKISDEMYDAVLSKIS